MSDKPVKSSLLLLPPSLPFWELAEIFDGFFNNTTDPVPEAARKLNALMRDNPQYTQIYLSILESRIKVARASLISSIYGNTNNGFNEEGGDTANSAS